MMGCDLDHEIGCNCGGDAAAMERITGDRAIARIQQLESALRIAYGQVQFYRGERKKAWDGDFVTIICEAALKGEPEPSDNWREQLRAKQETANG